MGDTMLYRDGVRRLIDLSKEVSELHRELHEVHTHLQECNRESIRLDEFYSRELLMKKEGLTAVYDQLLLQVCINHCFDMKSWRIGKYSYNRQDVLDKVEEFNVENGTTLQAEDVLKSLRFDYDMNVEISRTERV